MKQCAASMLYLIERQIKDLSNVERTRIRAEASVPQLASLHEWSSRMQAPSTCVLYLYFFAAIFRLDFNSTQCEISCSPAPAFFEPIRITTPHHISDIRNNFPSRATLFFFRARWARASLA
jgi:hypothetical protein